MLVLILATWTTNTGNAYMSGLAACKMFSIKDSKRPLVTMISVSYTHLTLPTNREV